MMMGKKYKMAKVYKYSQESPTEEDKKHPEFDDPFIDDSFKRPATRTLSSRQK